MTRPHSFKSSFIVGVGYSISTTWTVLGSNPSCWMWGEKTFQMEMQDHTCLLDHPLCHAQPRPSSNPVGTTVPLAIAHILIGLHSQTPIVYRPIWHALIPKKSRRRDPISLINHTIQSSKLPIDLPNILCTLFVASSISDTQREGEEERHAVMD